MTSEETAVQTGTVVVLLKYEGPQPLHFSDPGHCVYCGCDSSGRTTRCRLESGTLRITCDPVFAGLCSFCAELLVRIRLDPGEQFAPGERAAFVDLRDRLFGYPAPA